MAEENELNTSGSNDDENDDNNPEPNGVYSDEDYSDPEGFADDITEEELLGDLLKQRPKETDGVESVIVVDGVPQVGPERLDKLKNVIRKIYSKFGKIVTEYYPEENGVTKGYIFLEYSSPANALESVKMTNGYKLDKQHIFSVNLFTDFDKYANIPDEWEPPEPQPYKDPGNLRYWLLDSDCCDQYSVIYDGGEKTTIMLNQPQEPQVLEERARWTETYVRWSTQGTYLATFHQRGIALWGGEKFKQIMKFSHSGVQLIDFSPCENYLVTFSPVPDMKEEPQSIIVWDIRTGAFKRAFFCENASVWPILKWSHDDQYFSKLGLDTLSIYETPHFGLLEKKSIKISGIRDFSWSPSDNIIAYWVAEDKDVPARVTVLEIPSRTELRMKNLFNVADCKMHWQKGGDFLGVKVDRYTKIKKEKNETKYSGMYFNFEIFHMREKHIPVDVVEIKENISAFAWEPVGFKFAIIHGEAPRINVSFYSIKTGGTVTLVKTFEKKQANHIFWAPTGQFVVLAGLRNMNGVLEFIDTNEMIVMNQTEHFMATDVEWDPTGRYVATAVSWWEHKVDNAYWIWSFQGRLMQRRTPDRFCQLLWRPRPASLLSAQKLKDIKKNLKKYSVQFESKDKMSQSKASKEQIERRRRMKQEFEEYRTKKEAEYAATKHLRLQLRRDIDTDELDSHTDNLEEETIEFFIKEIIEE